MSAAYARSLLDLAGLTPLRFAPMPEGFMRLLRDDGRRSVVPCLADEHIDAGDIVFVDLFGDGRVAIVAHPIAWAAHGALNLATAYRPEGL